MSEERNSTNISCACQFPYKDHRYVCDMRGVIVHERSKASKFAHSDSLSCSSFRHVVEYIEFPVCVMFVCVCKCVVCVCVRVCDVCVCKGVWCVCVCWRGCGCVVCGVCVEGVKRGSCR